MAAKKSVKRVAPDASARHLWLAGLGLTSMATRNTVDTASKLVGEATRLRERALGDSRALIGELRDQIATGVDQFGRSVESALSPLVAKLQPKKAQRKVRRGRKAATKTVRRAVRKAPAKPIKRRRR